MSSNGFSIGTPGQTMLQFLIELHFTSVYNSLLFHCNVESAYFEIHLEVSHFTNPFSKNSNFKRILIVSIPPPNRLFGKSLLASWTSCTACTTSETCFLKAGLKEGQHLDLPSHPGTQDAGSLAGIFKSQGIRNHMKLYRLKGKHQRNPQRSGSATKNPLLWPKPQNPDLVHEWILLIAYYTVLSMYVYIIR